MVQVLWDGYIDGMKKATFNADTNLYIASGLEASSTGGCTHLDDHHGTGNILELLIVPGEVIWVPGTGPDFALPSHLSPYSWKQVVPPVQSF